MRRILFAALIVTLGVAPLSSQNVKLYHPSGKSASEMLNDNFGPGASESFVEFIKSIKYLVKHRESVAIGGLIKFPFVYQDSKGDAIKIHSRSEFDKRYKKIFDEKIVNLILTTNENDWKVDQLGVGVGIDKVYFQCRSNEGGLYWRLVTVNQW